MEPTKAYERRRKLSERILVAVIVAGVLAFIALVMIVVPARAWELGNLNKTVDQTNFLVNDGCSGTLISLKHRLVLTNHHCVASFISTRAKEQVQKDGTVKKVRVEERRDVPLKQQHYAGFRKVGSTSYLAMIVAHKQTSDLALLKIRAESLPYTAASRVLPKDGVVIRGMTVYAVGNPRGLDATVTKGVVSSLNRLIRVPWADGAEVPFIQFSGGIFFGNSGGALYNDAGYLIGVPAAIAGAPHLGLAIPYTAIRAFLDEACYTQVWNPAGKNRDGCK